MRSDAQHIALERARVTCNILRKSAFWREQMSHDDSIMRQLHALQDTLRGSGKHMFDPAVVVAPFVAIVREAYLAGPYKLIALDTIHTLLSCNILQGCDNACDTLTEIVDAVTRCKFVQTDAAGDDLVTLRLVQVLHEVIKSHMRVYLTDAAAWDIVESCYAVLVRGPYHSALSQVAEQALFDTVRFIFSSATNTPSSSSILGRHSLGYPCAVKLLGFFVNVLKKHTIPDQADDTADGRSPMGSVAEGSASAPATPIASATGSSSFQYLGDAPRDGVSSEIVLAIKIISCMIVSEGDLSAPRETILKCLPLVSLIRDDLGLCLILLASRTDLPPVVLQGVLSLFATLVRSLGPMLFVLVESFLVHVYLKSLNQLHTLLDGSVATFGATNGKVGPTINVSVTTSPNSCAYAVEQLEIILESLLDVLSDSSFLSMIFVSFDCDPSRVDILKPMFSYLCRCARYSLTAQDSYRELGTLDVATSMSMQCLMQVVTSLGDRCDVVPPDTASDIGDDPRKRMYSLSLNLRATRAAKKIIHEASLRFEKKPEYGLAFLQSMGALPSPLTPNSVAKFLRLSSDIPKEVVGSYLGELGKDSPKFEGDAKDFHKEVLICYIRSFPLSGQNILSCVRVFLSAFRLPGEAQQIDRILNAFSEHCFECCMEKAENIIENAEIAYVLSFSIIMLNTDRHNVNIRADRKMTLDQFIKNNTNYGRDLKQTKDLPRDYLESIYQSISNFPLRTEKNDETGSVTIEGWLDAQQQATLHVEKGLLTVISHKMYTLEVMRQCTRANSTVFGVHQSKDDSSSGYDVTAADTSTSAMLQVQAKCEETKDHCSKTGHNIHPNLEMVSQHAIKVVYNLLTTNVVPDTFDMSIWMYGQQNLVDADLAEVIWKDLLAVIAYPFVGSGEVAEGTAPSGDPIIKVSSGDNALSVALALAIAVIKISHWYAVPHACDAVVLLLAEFAKVLQGDFLRSLFSSNGLLQSTTRLTEILEPHGLNQPLSSTSPGQKKYVGVESCQRCGIAIVQEKPARAALCALLKLAHLYPQYLSAIGWTVIFLTMSMLRDLSVLPADMVLYFVKDESFDGIPPSVRKDFEDKMNASNATMTSVEEPKAKVAVPRSKKSLLSFQGLGEALFGTTDVEDLSPDGCSGAASERSIDVNISSRLFPGLSGPLENCSGAISMASRWDFGYTYSSVAPSGGNIGENQMPSVDIISDQQPVRGSGLGDSLVDASNGRRDRHDNFNVLMQAIKNCGVSDIISDSKFVDDTVILRCIQALVNLSDNFSGWGFYLACASKRDELQAGAFDWSWNQHYSEVDMVGALVEGCFVNFPDISMASSSWLEVVIVELVVRNRDRIASLWPYLAVHYVRSAVALSAYSKPSGGISGSSAPLQQQPLNFESKSSSHKLKAAFSYVDERRVVGLLKIASKMFSRQQLAPKALNLLHALLCGGNSIVMENYIDWFGIRDFSGNIEELCSAQYLMMTPIQRVHAKERHGERHDTDFLKSWPKPVVETMTSQIAVELWQMLTLNVSTLSHMQLAQWQQLFDVISITSAGNSFAAGKAYEVMAWLIHEPRLRGEVPVFSLSGVRPLLTNPQAHDSVATGAIELLTHLHNRLEVLVSSEEFDVLAMSPERLASDIAHRELRDGNDSSALWESCWVPILQVMAVGVLDHRPCVKIAAARALCAALRDRHIHVVPVDVVVTILSTILVHTASQLNDGILEHCLRIRAVDVTVDPARPKPAENRPVDELSMNGVTGSAGDIENSMDDRGCDDIEIAEIIFRSMCEVFCSHLTRLHGHSLFQYVWLSVLRVLLFHEQHDELFSSMPSSFQLGVPRVVPELLVEVLSCLETAGLFVETLDAAKQSPHRPIPPRPRNNLWFVTSSEISQVVPSDKIKVLFPKFVLP